MGPMNEPVEMVETIAPLPTAYVKAARESIATYERQIARLMAWADDPAENVIDVIAHKADEESENLLLEAIGLLIASKLKSIRILTDTLTLAR